MISIGSSHGEIIHVPEEAAAKSAYVQQTIEEFPDDIVQTNIKLDILKKVFEYCEYICNDGVTEPQIEMPLKFADLAHEANGIEDQWFIEYIKSFTKK